MFGLAEALAHLERALALWAAVPDAAELVRARSRRALLLGGRARQPDGRRAARGRARPASDRARRRERPAARGAPARAPRPLPARERQDRRRPRRVRARGRARAGAAALAGARARRWRRSAHGLMLAWRYDESLAICEQALALARAVGAREPSSGRSRCSAATSPTSAAATRASRSSRQALQLAEQSGDPDGAPAGLRLADRRADDARTATRVGRGWRARRSPPSAGTGSTTPCSSPTGSRRCSRSASGTRPTAPAPPRCAPSPPTTRTCC